MLPRASLSPEAEPQPEGEARQQAQMHVLEKAFERSLSESSGVGVRNLPLFAVDGTTTTGTSSAADGCLLPAGCIRAFIPMFIPCRSCTGWLLQL